MINDKSCLWALRQRFGENSDFVKPEEEGYSFTKIIPTVKELLLGHSEIKGFKNEDLCPFEQPKRVVVCMVDGFGWRSFLRHHKNIPFLNQIAKSESAMATLLCCQFPSTTSAHVVSMATGLPPALHGCFEWNIYIPEVDEQMFVLPYEIVQGRVGGQQRFIKIDAEKQVAPNLVFPSKRDNIYQQLAEHGVKSITVTPQDIYNSVTSKYLNDSAECYHFKTIRALPNLWEQLLRKDWSYCHFYVSTFDRLSHLHGPDSDQARRFLVGLSQTLARMIELSRGHQLLFLITADHGQIEVTPRDPVQILDVAPDLINHLKRYQNNADFTIPASGGLRNLFLHVQEDYVSAAIERINSRVPDKLEAFETDTLLDQGLFGNLSLHNNPECHQLRDRLGTVTIIPKGHNSVFFDGRDTQIRNNKGHHGGASPEEMGIPLLSIFSD